MGLSDRVQCGNAPGHEGEQVCGEALRQPQPTEPAHRPEDDRCEHQLLQRGGAATSVQL
ncbi:unnamed protein product [Symbiodinium necroappetens]|uniref:Uncharacterized protein n=1 Tax=Symbiodinium necroappetens TaxID=1628268 RepID=A0A812XS22_9DINO|nr:unnamed protein product [Symbiodinium necroappetens]